MNDIHWIELCCGSAAMTWHLLGDKVVAPVSYTGSKAGYAAEIAATIGIGRPSSVTLNDPGTWGKIWPPVIATPTRVSDHLLTLATDSRDPKALFLDLSSMIDSEADPSIEAALRLCKVAGTFGGKEIGGFKGKHKLRPNVDGFIPNRRTIAERTLGFSKIDPTVQWKFFNQNAQTIEPPLCTKGTYVYLDPPYVGSESVYANSFSREDVLTTAIKWADAGANVIISEAVPLCTAKELVDHGGWESIELISRVGQARKNSKSTKEFITFRLQSKAK